MFQEEVKRLISWIWYEHRGKFVGCLTGVVLGFIFLLIGFWRAIVILMFAGAGLWLGNAVDKGEDLLGQLKEWRPGGFSRYK